MRCFLGLRGAHSWRNSWMLTVNEYLWIRLQLLSCLTVVASEWSRRRMRFPFLSLSLLPFAYISVFDIPFSTVLASIWRKFVSLLYVGVLFSLNSLKWKMGMRLMQCFTRLEVPLMEDFEMFDGFVITSCFRYNNLIWLTTGFQCLKTSYPWL